jgi:HD-GYP domain-containing protein (c-di-GMP phosphodiesterase class II)
MPSSGTLALLTAAFLLAELFQRSDDELLPELDGERFSLSAPVHVASIIVLGAWPAALIGVVGTLAVRPFKGEPWRKCLVRAAGLGIAALAGGLAFQLAGSTPGEIHVSEDLLAIVVLGMVYGAIRSLAAALIGGRLLPQADVLTIAAEVGLGLLLAFAALENLWLAAALAPVLLLLDSIYRRLGRLRREMAMALETFANIVDERDPSTHGHSVRVAQYVRELADGLGLPRAEASRLWWAGRLHDLGKVAVDASVLRKPGKLDDAEWATVRRAPRLSARLLQRFRFAAAQAQAVEYHRERYDGSGYYGAQLTDLPLAAHFLIVADSFDAMTTDRPFKRRRLTHVEALEEIERGSGTQFHPAIAKAFVAIRRGIDPAEVLTAEELGPLRDAGSPDHFHLPRRSELRRRPELLALGGVTVALGGLGMGFLPVTLVGASVALLGLRMWTTMRLRTRRLSAAVDDALAGGENRTEVFGRVVDAVGEAWRVDYAALVEWCEDGAGGTLVLERGHETGPPEPVLVSWLLREAESGNDISIDLGAELSGGHVSLALPLRRENSALVGFLVLRGLDRPAPHVWPALRGSVDRIGLTFAEAPETAVVRSTEPLDPDGREHAGALEA